MSNRHTQPAAKPLHAVPSQPSRKAAVTHEQIARRAYELYLARGGTHGRHEDDWLRAERELRQLH